jgi:hypothetical protein
MLVRIATSTGWMMADQSMAIARLVGHATNSPFRNTSNEGVLGVGPL